MSLPTSPRVSRRRLLLGAGGGLAALAAPNLLAACGGDQGPAGNAGSGGFRATWFGGEERHKRTIEAFTLIEQKIGGGLTINEEFGGFEGYFDKLTTQISGGNAPNLAQTNFPLSALAGRNALTDLTSYVDKGLDMSAIPERDRQGGYFEDKLYGVSLGTVVPAVVVDTTALKPLGVDLPKSWTWEEYAEVADEISKASGGKVAGTEDTSSYGQALDAWVMSRGRPGLFGPEGQVAVEVADVEEWFAYWDKLRRSGGTVPIDVQAAHNNGDHPTNPVNIGKAVLGMQFNTTIGVWSTITKNTLAFAPMPTGANPSNYARPSAMWSVPRGTKDVDQAVKVIDLFINDPDVARVLGFTRAVPNANALKAIGDNLSESDKALKSYTESVLSGQLVPAPTTPSTANEAGPALKRAAESVAFGQARIPEAAKSYVEELKGMAGA